MAGCIFFTKHNWAVSSWATFYVLNYLASQVPDAATKQELSELVDNNIPLLDLSDPRRSALVDIIANDLPRDMPTMDDPKSREALTSALTELIEYAREQQLANEG